MDSRGGAGDPEHVVSNPSGAPETRQTTVGCLFGPTESFCPGNIRWAEFALSLLIFFCFCISQSWRQAGMVYTRRKAFL